MASGLTLDLRDRILLGALDLPHRVALWTLAFLLNLIVPSICALVLTEFGGWAGIAMGAFLLWAAGSVIVAWWRRPGTALTVGAFVVAVTQCLPFLQFMAGMFALGLWEFVSGESASVEGGGSRLSAVGGFSVTVMVGQPFALLAFLIGCAFVPPSQQTRRGGRRRRLSRILRIPSTSVPPHSPGSSVPRSFDPHPAFPPLPPVRVKPLGRAATPNRLRLAGRVGVVASSSASAVYVRFAGEAHREAFRPDQLERVAGSFDHGGGEGRETARGDSATTRGNAQVMPRACVTHPGSHS